MNYQTPLDIQLPEDHELTISEIFEELERSIIERDRKIEHLTAQLEEVKVRLKGLINAKYKSTNDTVKDVTESSDAISA